MYILDQLACAFDVQHNCWLIGKDSRAGALGGYFLRNPQLQGSGRQALYIAAVAAFNIALGASQGSMIDNSGAGMSCAALLVCCFALRSRRSCGVYGHALTLPTLAATLVQAESSSRASRQPLCALPSVHWKICLGLPL